MVIEQAERVGAWLAVGLQDPCLAGHFDAERRFQQPLHTTILKPEEMTYTEGAPPTESRGRRSSTGAFTL